jgi:hypothetical protein
MTRDFPHILSRLIPRLGSPFDHEVTATARAIERALKSQKLDWHDVAAAVTAQAPPSGPPCVAESDDAARMRIWLEAVSREPWPNDWTQKFIAGVLRRPLDRLSKKQVACANNIVAEAYRRGVRVDRSAA